MAMQNWMLVSCFAIVARFWMIVLSFEYCSVKICFGSCEDTKNFIWPLKTNLYNDFHWRCADYRPQTIAWLITDYWFLTVLCILLNLTYHQMTSCSSYRWHCLQSEWSVKGCQIYPQQFIKIVFYHGGTVGDGKIGWMTFFACDFSEDEKGGCCYVIL